MDPQDVGGNNQMGMGQDIGQSQTSQVPDETYGQQNQSVPAPSTAQIPTGAGVPPEFEPVPTSSPVSEQVEVVEVKEYEVSPEVQEYVEKVEKENLELEKPVVHQGQPVIHAPYGAEEPNIVLPMTRAGVTVGLAQKVTRGARWLAEWCMRIIKKFHGRVFYAPEKRE